jgi:hypothetical protein
MAPRKASTDWIRGAGAEGIGVAEAVMT